VVFATRGIALMKQSDHTDHVQCGIFATIFA
jgi:hypothetical protein